MKRQVHLNLFIHSRGHHEAAWRHPAASPFLLTDFRYYKELTLKAESAFFDSIFLSDILALGSDIEHTPRAVLDPIPLMGSLSAITSNIGIIGTASTTYVEPYNLARQFASLDHLSNGRVAWNIVTTSSAEAATNYSANPQAGIEERYERADEFMTVVNSLWDSWAADAVLDDRLRGQYTRPGRIVPIDHHGDFYDVSGPLTVPRGPQGRPVHVQAGSSEPGRAFAAKHGEAIFTAVLEKTTAQDFYRDIKSRVISQGRSPDQCVIMPGLSPVIASTEAQAHQYVRELDELGNIDTGLKRLSVAFGGIDLSHIDLDRTLVPDDFPDPETLQGGVSRPKLIVDLIRNEQPTLRQLLSKLSGARGHYTFAGTAEQVADLMEDWINDKAADGFNLMPPVLPEMFDIFIAEVIPLLQQRGIFRTHYEGVTLRDHYGLMYPDSRFK
ncbi:MAG: LLM class flavin-dependent oxidoreductase [Chloroflexi bacterium]|nr:LLM class flavin-dependent oxidoreductase [Chloroflexota bacterium]